MGNNNSEKTIKSKENIGENKYLLSHTQLVVETAQSQPRW